MKRFAPIDHRRRQLVFWALAGIAWLVAHDLVWLVQIGPGEALARALRAGGHGYWSAASVGLVGIAAIVLVASLARLLGLWTRARSIGAGSVPRPRARYARRAAGTWLRMAVLVAIAFTIQENLEHGLTHGHVPGIGILHGPEYPLALPVIAGITLVAALVAALVSEVDATLVAFIAAALRALGRHAPRDLRRPPLRVLVRLGSPVSRHDAGRAPPPLLPAA